MNATSAQHPVDSRRNIAAYIFDISVFGAGMAFIPSATVIVGLAGQLTKDKSLVGLAGMAFAAAWFLPQLFAARLVRNRPRQMNFLLIPSLFARPMFLLIALWLVMTRAIDPLATFWIMIAAVTIFCVLDALAGVAWFDIMSRTLSPRIRSRVMATGHTLAGFLGLGASEAVKRILSNPEIAFPLNYAILFGSAFFCMAVSTIAFFVMREVPMAHAELQEQSQSHFMADLRSAAQSDTVFRRVVAVRLLTGLEAMAASFYLVFLKEKFTLGAATDGDMTQAIIFGSMAGVAFFGWLADRFTSRRVVHISSVMWFVTPLLAALVAILPIPLSAAYAIFIVVFVLRGALDQSLSLGIIGYMLDAAPERNRALYVGAINSVGGVVSVTPFLGGLWIDLFGHDAFRALPYAVLFSVVTASAAIGMLVSLKLPAPRRS